MSDSANTEIIIGKLHSFNILVGEQWERSRLANMAFGKKINEGTILNPIEALFLINRGKLKIFSDGIDITSTYYTKTCSQIPDFDIMYATYFDLRNRGMIVIIDDNELSILRDRSRPETAQQVFCYADRNDVDVQDIVSKVVDYGNDPLFSIVSNDGRISYYHLSIFKDKGQIAKIPSKIMIEGIWYGGDSIFVEPDSPDAESLFESGIGTLHGDLRLSLVESIYLMTNGQLHIRDMHRQEVDCDTLKRHGVSRNSTFILECMTYSMLKDKRFRVSCGLNYGVPFTIYERPPHDGRSYTIHLVEKKIQHFWTIMSSVVRVSSDSHKKCAFAYLGDELDLICIEFVRPGVMK